VKTNPLRRRRKRRRINKKKGTDKEPNFEEQIDQTPIEIPPDLVQVKVGPKKDKNKATTKQDKDPAKPAEIYDLDNESLDEEELFSEIRRRLEDFIPKSKKLIPNFSKDWILVLRQRLQV